MLAVLATSTLSGVFGMAGGLLLMGALLVVLPVPQAMVAHGILQLTANGSRAVLHRAHVHTSALLWYAAGSVVAALLLRQVVASPDKAWVYLGLGLLPVLAWLPQGRLLLDATRSRHALACGVGVTVLHVVAGVAGPLLDLFFVRAPLGRHAIVATKAATQVLAHTVKVAFYAGAALAAPRDVLALGWLAAARGLAVLGSWLGGQVLARMTDRDFARWTRWIITAVGVLYLGRAGWLFWAG